MSSRTIDSSGLDEPRKPSDGQRHLLAHAIQQLIETRVGVQQLAIRMFPIGSAVRRRTTGVCGTVHATVAGFPERLAILLENGNVWDYPVMELERIEP